MKGLKNLDSIYLINYKNFFELKGLTGLNRNERARVDVSMNQSL